MLESIKTLTTGRTRSRRSCLRYRQSARLEKRGELRGRRRAVPGPSAAPTQPRSPGGPRLPWTYGCVVRPLQYGRQGPQESILGADDSYEHANMLSKVKQARARRRRCASLQDLDLGVKRRRNLERRNARPLQVRVEKAVHVVRRNCKLAASIDTENAQHAERSQDDVALQQRAIAESEVIPTADQDLEPAVNRQSIV